MILKNSRKRKNININITRSINMSKVLVTYFSASGVTAALSKRLADSIGAD